MRPTVFLAVLAMLAVGAGPAGAGLDLYSAAVPDLSHPEAAVQAMRDAGATQLSAEALAMYQEGIQAARLGQKAQAVDRLQAAAELDPAFPEPHLALARLHLPGQPQVAVVDLWRAVQATGRSFGAQHLLLVNTIFGFFFLVGAAGLILLVYAALRLLPRVHHTLNELLRRWMGPLPAKVVAVVLLASPLLWRVGLVPSFLLYGGLMWAWMNRGDRRWTVTLAGLTVAVPLVLWGLSPVLYSPLDPAGVPHLLSRAMSAPYSPGLEEALREAVRTHPENADLYFALGMTQKRGGRLAEAKEAYRNALRFGTAESAAENNLGVIAFQEGRYQDAMDLFEKSIRHRPNHAGPHFNLSQAYAKKLLFDKADEEMLEANRLSFKRIRAALRREGSQGENPLLDEPLPPSAYWAAAWQGPHRLPGTPAWTTIFFPGSLALFPVVSLALFGLGLLVGTRMYRALPSFGCANCGRAVCRRCLRRIHRAAYCQSCGDALLRIQSAAYSRLVLDSRLQRSRKAASAVSRLAGWMLPGYHASRAGHTDLAAALTMVLTAAGCGLFATGLPVTRLAWIETGHGLWWPELPVALLLVAWGVSWITMMKLQPGQEETHHEHDGESDAPAGSSVPGDTRQAA